MFKLISFAVLVCITTACAKKTSSSSSSEDSSASGSALSVVGGALSTSSSGGAVSYSPGRSSSLSGILAKGAELAIPNANAMSCLKPQQAAGNSACATSGKSLWITDAGCTHGNSLATWTGTTLIQVSGTSSQNAACGSFPVPGASGTLVRQYVMALSSATPGTMSRTNARGTTVVIDDATANLGNFDTGHTVATILGTGYGTRVNFNASGVRASMDIYKHQYVVGGYDHSVEGSLTISEASAGASSRVLNGTLKVYHNRARIIGTSVFTDVTHSDSCCTPVSGTIETTFSTGQFITTPTALGSAMVGKKETLVITGCGTANLTNTDGTASAVTLNNCF